MTVDYGGVRNPCKKTQGQAEADSALQKNVIAPPATAIRSPDRAARPRRARVLTEGLQLYPLPKKHIPVYGYEIPHRAEWTSFLSTPP